MENVVLRVMVSVCMRGRDSLRDFPVKIPYLQNIKFSCAEENTLIFRYVTSWAF